MKKKVPIDSATRDRTRDLQIFSLELSQLSYRGKFDLAAGDMQWVTESNVLG